MFSVATGRCWAAAFGARECWGHVNFGRQSADCGLFAAAPTALASLALPYLRSFDFYLGAHYNFAPDARHCYLLALGHKIPVGGGRREVPMRPSSLHYHLFVLLWTK